MASLNGVVALAVLAVVAVLALVVKPPAPPGIAAFAPQATRPITKAPQAQSAAFGDGQGRCAAGQTCVHPSPTSSAGPVTASTAGPVSARTPRGVPSALQCYTWPDGTVTQTFDPQSPPCIASWDERKGNGGATSPGVTATEVRVALPVNNVGGPTGSWPDLKPIVDFFNTHYQLYGRQIKIVPFVSQQANEQYTGTYNDPSAQHADAERITQLKVFAATDFVDPAPGSASLSAFRGVLTSKKIVSLAGGEQAPFATSRDLAAAAPYEWSYYSTIDTLMRNVAAMTCRQLAGKPAGHAPDPALRSKPRTFALLVPEDRLIGGPLPGLDDFIRALKACGVPTPKLVRYTNGSGNNTALAAEFQQLAGEGVTSLVYLPYQGSGTGTSPMEVAQSVNFRPEWVLIGHSTYLTAHQLNNPQSETSGAFGVGLWNKMPALNQEMWAEAYLAAGGDPGPVNSGSLIPARGFYDEMLLLAAGLQMAGPHLTPQSFADGLRSTTFPNPGAGAAPMYQGRVGFVAGDAAMVRDFAGIWLDTTMPGPAVVQAKDLNETGAFCYVALGDRWEPDTWPTRDGFYSGRCR